MSTPMPVVDIAPPEFLQLAGHPLRWRLLTELAHSDRMVQELTRLVSEPQNLVSYHLGKLRDGRLVAARRSSADGRDAYYTADLGRIGDLLSASGSALHPFLRLAPTPIARSCQRTVRVLFLCTGNGSRSQMAEALLRSFSDGVIDVRSAGSHPKPVHPNTVRVMRDRYGLDITGYASKHVDVFAGARFDWVISLCDRVREVCPEFPGRPQTIHWSIANPAAGDGDDEATYPLYEQTAEELSTRIGFLFARLTDGSTRATPEEEP